MGYSTRNSFYLRISKTVVLPLYVYLDERHVNWMSDKVLQHVLSDLRPHILGKLRAESDLVLGGKESTQKKVTVDTHRGDTYQFCYFLRRTVPHSLLIKSRTFTLAPAAAKGKGKAPVRGNAQSKKRKEPSQSSPPAQPRKRQTRRKASPAMVVSDDDENGAGQSADDSDEEYLPENPVAAMLAQRDAADVMDIDVLEDEEEEKPKPVLGLTYQGFNLYGQCLCVVVEPWPIVRATTTPAMLAGHTKAKAPPSSTAPAKEPLFLPEEPEENNPRLPVPDDAPTEINRAYLDQVLHDTQAPDEGVENEEDDNDMGGMLDFSQILYYSGDMHSGAINDEDAGEAILFGDADEVKEL